MVMAHVTTSVTLFSNYLHYKLIQESSAMVDQVVEVQNQNSKVRSSNLKSQVLFSVNRYTQSVNFQNLSEFN
jgi:hypothetical protein